MLIIPPRFVKILSSELATNCRRVSKLGDLEVRG